MKVSIDMEACEKLYGKLVSEDEGFWYFEGKHELGITIPKKVFWDIKIISDDKEI